MVTKRSSSRRLPLPKLNYYSEALVVLGTTGRLCVILVNVRLPHENAAAQAVMGGPGWGVSIREAPALAAADMNA